MGMDTSTFTSFARACSAGAAQASAEVNARVHARFRSTARSPCHRDDLSFLALVGYPPHEASLTVKTLAGRVVAVLVSPVALVAEVKAAIEDVEGVPADQRRLFCGGLLLQDGRNLNDCNVCRDSFI